MGHYLLTATSLARSMPSTKRPSSNRVPGAEIPTSAYGSLRRWAKLWGVAGLENTLVIEVSQRLTGMLVASDSKYSTPHHCWGGLASRTSAPNSSLRIKIENLAAVSRSLVLSEA